MLWDDNGIDVGVSYRTTDESDFTHPRKTQVGNILALAKKESLIFFSFTRTPMPDFMKTCIPSVSQSLWREVLSVVLLY